MRSCAAVILALCALASARASANEVPFRLIDNRIFVPVTVNGRGPFQFLLDTGAPDFTLSVATMNATNARVKGTTQASGVGEHTDTAYNTHVKLLELAGAQWQNLDGQAISFQALSDVIGFTALDGVAGKPVFDRFVVDFDFATSTLRLIAPAQYSPLASAHIVPFVIYQDFMPLVDGEVGGVKGKFIVDTGDRSSLTLFGPFWRAHKLDKAFGKSIETLTGYGVGGPVRSLVVRVPKFALGSVPVNGVVTRLSLQKAGAFADPNIAGSIGTGVLKRFHTAFDYSRHRIVLADDASVNRPDQYDRGGVWIGRHGTNFEIFDAVAGGPAERAGLRKGDVIVAVNGVVSPKIDLFQLRHRLADPAEKGPLVIDAMREGKKVQARLLPADLLPQN
jgi:hypothetical protein